ncbi:MAG: single-stranded-DNA-specific exonuclease RecJ [Gemmatimonadetes bacterium]|nr:single-stranded-DNA-specific exonuclease RecJ [Gemmatimonadota bacterium]
MSAPALAPTRKPRPRWIEAPAPDPAELAALSAALALPPVVARLLLARGHASPDVAKEFLRPRLERLHPPEAMGGMDVAVERLQRALRNDEMIMVHGDYDVDGICSTTLLTRVLRRAGARVTPFIPHRLTDGYDLTMAGVRAAEACGARVVVTADCGTSAVQPIAELQRRGVDVIITDHHLPGGPLPPALAVLNPRAPGNGYPDPDLAAVGVAFKLALALARAVGIGDGFVFRMLDLVALATIADVAPLRGENRLYARYGLKLMAESDHAGIRALIRAAGLDGKPITAGRVGFILAPRLNAVGRLGAALRGVELLLCETEAEAHPIARELEELNRERQEMDRRTLEEARAMVAALDLDATYGLVLAGEGWHAGVIGIVASRIVEDTGRPALLIALENGQGKGSGRSIPAFDLHGALGACKDLLIRYGGHRAAAGVTVEASQVDALARRFNDVARAQLTADDLVPELRVDAELGLEHATPELEKLLTHFEPFGIGNASPTFAARNVQVIGAPRVIGKDGLRLRLAAGAGEIAGVGWGLAPLAALATDGARIDVAWKLERDEYRGESSLQAKLVDLVPARR